MKRFTAFLFGAAILSAACGGGGGGGGNGPSVTIAKAGAPNGDGQTAEVTAALADSLKVLVLEDGNPKVGATVAWSTTGGGSLSPTSSQTDAAGIAESRWTLGQTSGTQTAQASLSGATGTPVSFSATANPGAPVSFTKGTGDGQTGTINQNFAAPLTAKVADQFGNGVSGVTVTWAVLSGSVTLTGGPNSVTAGTGFASKSISAGASAGPAQVRAITGSVNGVNLDFDLTVTLPPVQVSVGNIFFHSVKNGSENPAVDTAQMGQPVRWSVTGGHTVESLGPPSFTSSGNLTTGDVYTITFSAPGTYQYDCAIHGSAMTGQIVVLP
jgi:plastocyanin